MHDICETQPKLWRGWDKLGNLLPSIAWRGCHPVSKGILTRFIVEMNYCIDEPKVWCSGVILKLDHTLAELIEIYHLWEIKIRLYGTNKRFFLEAITEKLDAIHNSYERLRVKKMISDCFVCKNSQNSHFYALDKLQQRIAKNEQNIECDKPPYNEVYFLSLRDDRTGIEKWS